MKPCSHRRYVAFCTGSICQFLLVVLVGCGTTTQKFATEQLLISDAVDQAINKIDFASLSGQDVFLDTKYLHSVKGTGYANSDYIISALREQLSAAGCKIQDTRTDANIIVEPRVGALGTDGHEITYGIPQTGQISTAAAVLSNVPAMPVIPEISFGKSDKQLGIAKITVFAYERESKLAVWQSGQQRSESTSNNTWVMGAGPFQKGTIHEGVRFAGGEIQDPRLVGNGSSLRNLRDRLLFDRLADSNAAQASAHEQIVDSNEAGTLKPKSTEAIPAPSQTVEQVADGSVIAEDKPTITR